MLKFALAGGSPGHVTFKDPLRGVHGFEYLCGMFDDQWTGDYVCRELIFDDPTILDDFDLCIMVVEWDYYKRPEVSRALDYADNAGVIMGCSGNGPYHKNILLTPPMDNEFRKRFDFYIDPAMDETTKSAFESLLGIPYFGGPPPYDPDAFQYEFDQADAGKFTLPDYFENSFLMGHELFDENLMTLLCAEAFDIPIVVTLWQHQHLNQSHFGQAYCQAFIDQYEAHTGFKNINFFLGLNQLQWLHALRMSRGIYYMTQFPSGGRPQIYAAAMGKPSIATGSAWQKNLFPDDEIPFGIEGAHDWQEREARALENAPSATARLQLFSKEKCQRRWNTFLTQNGWV